ncbi:SH3 domain-containing protein [Mesorhizobium sp. LHD-90]|uniref:SH3 domain-containing protein n=1 Tax=Mesorhizobium sp. LHD-90 TaxID=3071414 RepID=UPI0027DFCCC1|nr:SH3 domain-containing protein [Mesorhizobium sp. LHD-90]MDQ6436429.1 SH3 domain-containing protein [Mesorhizobium sp. LHD-90]
MRSGLLSALAGLLLLLSAGVSFAQTESTDETEPVAPPAPVALPPFDPNAEAFVVEGVAYNDLLNVRATPSAGGKLVGRLPNGALLRNHGCKENNGANWCDVESFEDAKVRGWVAARYLYGEAIEGLPEPPAGGTAAAATPPDAGTQAATPPAGFDAIGDIPCARYYGQPMTHCSAAVKRGVDGEATITVTWPDGGERVILFTNGRADNSDSTDPLTYTREADLNMIRIGKAERFEIPDALPFGG